MYESFFHLERTPFSTVPDPNCVHLVGQHADAISGLAYGVMSRKGYLLLTGEAGLGKTTALGAMSHLLGDADVQLSMILNPILTGREFMEMVLLNFGFQQIPESKAQRLKMLQEFLIRSDQAGKISTLIVDEAHQLSAESLEEVRLLGNFEASDHKLLQIVLAGQDELNNRLNLPDLWQLKQRIVVRMSLHRLDRDAVKEYVRFRWGKAGGADPLPFTDAAVDAIALWSHGIPRLINSICDNALLIAFSAATQTVDAMLIREACIELDLPVTPLKARLKTPLAVPPPKAAPAVAVQQAAPQFWQYSGGSLREKAVQLVADQNGGIPYRMPMVSPGPANLRRQVLPAVAGLILLGGISAYYLVHRNPSVSATPEAEAPVVLSASTTAAQPTAVPALPRAEAAVPRPQVSEKVPDPPAAPFTVGGEEQQANLVERVSPVYPTTLAQSHVQGSVRFQALIGTGGSVKSLKVIGGTPELIEPAMDAVKQWRYRPLLINGEPVEVVTEIDVDGPADR